MGNGLTGAAVVDAVGSNYDASLVESAQGAD